MLKIFLNNFFRFSIWIQLNLHNNISQSSNLLPISIDLDLLDKEISEIELNFKSNYNVMLTNILDFKNQLDHFTKTLTECERKISFLKNSHETNQNQLSLFLQMYDLKSKTEPNFWFIFTRICITSSRKSLLNDAIYATKRWFFFWLAKFVAKN